MRPCAERARSLLARPDDFASQYNLGNLHLERGDPAAAAERYRKALALRPDHLASLVNLSMAEARLGRLDEAEAALREAIRVQPREASAHFNLGLLLAERQRPAEAQAALRRALELDPRNAAAAYNLAVLVAPASPKEAAALAGAGRRPRAAGPALRLHPGLLPREGRRRGRGGARRCGRSSPATRATATAGRSWARSSRGGKWAEAAEVYRRAAGTVALATDRMAFEARARRPAR